ncbi:MAG: hypothetical protein ACYTG1_11615 [Planctomycetota bacterium]
MRRRPRPRRGGLLLEVLVSIALFAGAAAFVLAAMRSALDGIDRAERRREALDLARSTIAELEAGLVSLGDLREGIAPGTDDALGPDLALPSRWRIDARTEPSPWRGLTLLELEVFEETGEIRIDLGEDESPTVVLRQLVRLRDAPGSAPAAGPGDAP